MTTSKARPKLLTAEDLLRLAAEGAGGELIRGVLVEKVSVSLLHGEIVMLLGSILISFIRPRGLGRIAGSDSGMMLERGTRHGAGTGHCVHLRGEAASGC